MSTIAAPFPDPQTAREAVARMRASGVETPAVQAFMHQSHRIDFRPDVGPDPHIEKARPPLPGVVSLPAVEVVGVPARPVGSTHQALLAYADALRSGAVLVVAEVEDASQARRMSRLLHETAGVPEDPAIDPAAAAEILGHSDRSPRSWVPSVRYATVGSTHGAIYE